MGYSHVLWDFNGTILDDVEAGVNSENVLLKRRSMPIIKDLEYYREIFCFPITEYYKKLGHDFEKESYDDVAHEWVEQYLNFSKSSKLHQGILEAFEMIKKKGIKQLILSATEREMLKKQVEELGITNYFDDILGLDNIHAISKVDIAVEWINKEKVKKAILIGDTTHDFEVSKAIGIDCALVSNGHQSKEKLIECKVPVFENITALLKSSLLINIS